MTIKEKNKVLIQINILKLKIFKYILLLKKNS